MTIFNKTLLTGILVATGITGAHADNVILHTPEGFQVLSLSPNGKWACGVYVDATMTTYGFRWNLEGGSIEMLGSETSIAWDVANDGTVSGEFQDPEALENKVPVTMPSYWRDGKWHHLELPDGAEADGIGYGISPDGQYMTGAIELNGYYTPVIWKNGEVHKVFPTSSDAVAFAVSPDGSSATGFSTRHNRTACYWAPDGTITYFADSPSYSESPWNYGRNFSPDGKKLLYWGGWEVEGDNDLYLYSVYNIETGERQRVPAPSYDSDMEFFDISNSGLLVGNNQQRGYVWDGQKGMTIDEYLTERGIDITDFDDFYMGDDYYVSQLPISNVIAVSEDENIFAMVYYNARGQISSLVLKADQDLSRVAPAEVHGTQLTGLPIVSLKWLRPVGATSIRGYNVYRDGMKINGFLPINALNYYDRSLQPGTYIYQISAVDVSGAETMSEKTAVTVEATDQPQQAPLHLFARQKGMDGAYFSWVTPMSNRVHKHYYNPEAEDLSGFGVYEAVEVEVAIKYDKAEINSYDGYSIAEVSFVPMAQHSGWKINLYTYDEEGALTLIASQPVTQELTLRAINTVKLDSAVALPDGDLIVAVSVMCDGTDTGIIGSEAGRVTAGYSDLLRQTTEADFYSAYERSTASGMSVSCISWAIDLGLEPTGYSEASNSIDHYNVYINDDKAAETDTCIYVTEGLGDGKYSLGVEAVYADGSKSEMAETMLTISTVYQSINDLDIDLGTEGGTQVTATWAAPSDCDLTSISYTKAQKHTYGIKGVEENGYAIMAGAEYPATMMRGLEGYKIKSFRFYPLADALFTFMLFEEDDMVCELEVDDYTTRCWNEIELPEEIYIKPNATYRLVLDCFDPVPNVSLLALDNTMPRQYVSDLYSIDNGETWNSLNIETSIKGNWMIGMEVCEPESHEIEVRGYDVIVDENRVNTSKVAQTSYTHDFGDWDASNHSMRVDVYYPDRYEAVKGQPAYFHLLPAGINSALISDIHLQSGDNYLIAQGEGICSLTLISTDGRELANAAGNRLNLSGVTSGVYVVRIQVGDKAINRKISITK